MITEILWCRGFQHQYLSHCAIWKGWYLRHTLAFIWIRGRRWHFFAIWSFPQGYLALAHPQGMKNRTMRWLRLTGSVETDSSLASSKPAARRKSSFSGENISANGSNHSKKGVYDISPMKSTGITCPIEGNYFFWRIWQGWSRASKSNIRTYSSWSQWGWQCMLNP